MIYHELETERLRLRLFTPADADAFYRILADPEVRRFMADGEHFSMSEARNAISRFVSSFETRGFGKWALINKEDGKLIGYCGLVVLGEEVGVELAYLLSKDYWGRGFATEAARACLRYGFESLNFERIAAVSTADNSASKRVMERLGMSYVKNIDYFEHDCVHYVIDRNQFRSDDSPYTAHEVR